MQSVRQLIGRIRLQLRGKNHVVGWNMSPAEARRYFSAQGKTVLTLFGYSAGYEDEMSMLKTVRTILSSYAPDTTILNIGATRGGIGAAYPLAKSVGFSTTGIVSSKVLDYPENVSEAAKFICIISDRQWGGRLPDSEELSPTSKAMIDCSDILIGIGGGEICRDELLAGIELGKPVHFYPAEIDHAWAIHRAEKLGLPHPDSYWGAAHAALKDEPRVIYER